MNIAGREIDSYQPPYCIAEISCNHNGSLDRALRLIDAAKYACADAVKFQCYEASTITIDHDGPGFILQDGPWKGKRLHDLYREAQTPFEWFPKLAEHAGKAGITWFASVFDKTSVDLLCELRCAALKIASFELVDLPLIRYAAGKGKPLILSTGMASREDISAAWQAVRLAQKVGEGELVNAIPLHCVSGYPTPAAEANLATLKEWAQFRSTCGISDHTTGIEIPIAATALGACMIEKHLKPDRATTLDSAFSLVPNNFKAMVEAVRRTWAALQPSQAKSEDASRPLRRSLYAVEDIPVGQPFTEANVRSIRPGNGLPPALIGEIVGKTAGRDIVRGEPMAWEMVK